MNQYCSVGNIKKETCDVYIGRGSKWGNPYSVTEVGRETAISNYKYDLLKKIENKELLRGDFEDLVGKKLGCYCKPYNDCHGDVIAEIVNDIDHYFPGLRLAVVGSRSFDNYSQFSLVMDIFIKTFPNIKTLVSGGASGADKFAEIYAKENNLEMDVYLAQWDILGRSAGFKRNYTIWENSDFGLAFWDGESKGTSHSFRIAKDQKKPIYIYNYLRNCYVNELNEPL